MLFCQLFEVLQPLSNKMFFIFPIKCTFMKEQPLCKNVCSTKENHGFGLTWPKKSLWNLQNHLFWDKMYYLQLFKDFPYMWLAHPRSIPSIWFWTRGMSLVVAPHSPLRHQSELWNRSSKCAKYLLSSADSEDEHSNCGTSSLTDSAAAASAPDAN